MNQLVTQLLTHESKKKTVLWAGSQPLINKQTHASNEQILLAWSQWNLTQCSYLHNYLLNSQQIYGEIMIEFDEMNKVQ